MSVSSICNKVFKIAIDDYHKENSVDAQNKNPFKDSSSLEKIIYDNLKNMESCQHKRTLLYLTNMLYFYL